MDLIFVTNNKHKLQEVSAIMAGIDIKVSGLEEIRCMEDIPETGDNLQDNALQKARHVFQKYHVDCFADDTGLEIEALYGRPGVFSARYAGEGKNFDDNMNKVLRELDGISDRRACFRTLIALIMEGKEYVFEGRVNGRILDKKRGSGGFGYDPIFLPDGFTETFAEMNPEDKNKISHRGKAIQKLIAFLKEKQIN